MNDPTEQTTTTETENTTYRWLDDFMMQYKEANHPRLSYTVMDGRRGQAASLELYLEPQDFRVQVSVDIGPIRQAKVNWVSGSGHSTVETTIATRDLMNVAIEVALAWSAHREQLEEASS